MKKIDVLSFHAASENAWFNYNLPSYNLVYFHFNPCSYKVSTKLDVSFVDLYPSKILLTIDSLGKKM